MSTEATRAAQQQRLLDAGLSVATAARYRDIDSIDDARSAGRNASHSRFATTLRQEGAA
jgi:hypothetical protein